MPDTPTIGDIYAFSFNFPPRGWAQCNGQPLPIAQNQALFSILGITYGGDGVTTFNLPNLIGRVPVGAGTDSGGVAFPLGQVAGEAAHSLSVSEMPQHNHGLRGDSMTSASSNSGTPAAGNSIGRTILSTGGSETTMNMYSTAAATTSLAPQAVANQGGGGGHENRQPYSALNYCIALAGVFPVRS